LIIFIAQRIGEYSHGVSEYRSVNRAGSITLANLTANHAPVGGETFLSNSAPNTTSSDVYS
jgi:hypothetical protein